MLSLLHVLQVNTNPENLAELADAIETGRCDSWQMAKGAKAGDIAVWYASGEDASYVAWRWVNGSPVKTEEGGFGPYRGPVTGVRKLRGVTRQNVKDECDFDGGHQGPQTIREAMTSAFLEAVSLVLIAEVLGVLG